MELYGPIIFLCLVPKGNWPTVELICHDRDGQMHSTNNPKRKLFKYLLFFLTTLNE